jgi:hypothetical protein
LCFTGTYAIEKSGFTNVGQAHYSTFKAHFCFFKGTKLQIKKHFSVFEVNKIKIPAYSWHDSLSAYIVFGMPIGFLWRD